jgi:hypothetical protein
MIEKYWDSHSASYAPPSNHPMISIGDFTPLDHSWVKYLANAVTTLRHHVFFTPSCPTTCTRYFQNSHRPPPHLHPRSPPDHPRTSRPTAASCASSLPSYTRSTSSMLTRIRRRPTLPVSHRRACAPSINAQASPGWKILTADLTLFGWVASHPASKSAPIYDICYDVLS